MITMIIRKVVRKIRNALNRRGLNIETIPHDNIKHYGTEYGGFNVITTGLSSESIVFSFGIGEDISFDTELIKDFGCKVIGFDPTPKSINWLEKQDLPKEYSYFPIGLADFNGVLTFAFPYNEEHVSISSVLENYKGTKRIELPVKKLKTFMDELGLEKIDILKMDIEGSEYAVIDNIISEKIVFDQLLVEFHHRFEGIGITKTNNAIKVLQEAGYELFAVSDNGEEMSFIKSNRAV